MTYDIDQLNRIEPAYLAAYGLTEAPFSPQHQDRFLYLSPELGEQLELLRHYTQYGNLLLIVSGEHGVGKTSLKQRFIATALEEWQICEIQAHTMMDASLLLKQVANGFGITEAPLDPRALFEVLSNQLEHLQQQAYEPILIIDDAHELPGDALQSLLYLAEHHSDQQSPLRIILFCEPEIEIMLEDPAIRSLRDRVTHSIEIKPLTEEETAEYLRHRLAVAGLDGTSPFTPKLVHKIYHASQGLPAKINEYAHQNLLDDSEPVIPEEIEYADEPPKSTYSLKNRVLGAIGLTIIVLTLLFQDRINKLFEEPEKNVAVPQQATATKSVTDTSLPAAPAETSQPLSAQKTIEFSLNNETTKKPQAAEIKPIEATKPEIVSTTEATKPGPSATDKTELTLTAVTPNPVTTNKQSQIISIRGTGFNKRQQVKIGWTGHEKFLSDTQVHVTSESFMNLVINVGTKPDTWKITVVDPLNKTTSNEISFKVEAAETQTTSTPAKITAAVAGTQIQGHAWIHAQNKNDYTLQLLSTHQKNSLPAYQEKFKLQNEVAIFQSERNGQTWFTLIYGHYPTKTAAQTAAAQLPKGMNKPWIRSFASIQTSLVKETKPQAVKSPLKSSSPTFPASKMQVDQESWLWSQDPRHYTLQLAAGTSKRAIEDFIKRHNLTDKAVYFHRIRDGKDWYILVYGSYSSLSSAKQGITKLPAALQKVKPWPRSFSAIHAELN